MVFGANPAVARRGWSLVGGEGPPPPPGGARGPGGGEGGSVGVGGIIGCHIICHIETKNVLKWFPGPKSGAFHRTTRFQDFHAEFHQNWLEFNIRTTFYASKIKQEGMAQHKE